MNSRYWSASASTEILARSTFCVRAKANSTSSGPSKPSRLTTRASSVPTASSAASHASNSAGETCGVTGLGGVSGADASASGMRFPSHARWKTCASDYTDSGRQVQHLREARLCLGNLKGLLLRKQSPRPFEALQGSPRKLGRHAGHRFGLLQAAVARQHHIGPGGDHGRGLIGNAAAQCLHGKVIAHEQTIKANAASDDFLRHPL